MQFANATDPAAPKAVYHERPDRMAFTLQCDRLLKLLFSMPRTIASLSLRSASLVRVVVDDVSARTDSRT